MYYCCKTYFCSILLSSYKISGQIPYLIVKPQLPIEKSSCLNGQWTKIPMIYRDKKMAKKRMDIPKDNTQKYPFRLHFMETIGHLI